MVDIALDGDDRWSIPDDRQLALRGRLDTGWSSYKGYSRKKEILTGEEATLLAEVLGRRDATQRQEEERIGKLVQKLESMHSNVLGDGLNTCLICATKAGLLKDSLRYCLNCEQMVCPKCSLEASRSTMEQKKQFYCVICNEERQLWKSSGAWFYRSLPKYTIPKIKQKNSNRHSNSMISRNSVDGHNGGSSWFENRSQSHESDNTDDELSCHDNTSFNAFDINSADQTSWHNRIETTNDATMMSSPATSHNRVRQKMSDDSRGEQSESPLPSINSDEGDVRSVDFHTSAHNNNHNSTGAHSNIEKQSSHSSSNSSLDQKEKKSSKLGIRRVMRRISQNSSDLDRISHPMPLQKRPSQEQNNNLSDGHSMTSSDHEFYSQSVSVKNDGEHPLPEKKEYYGKIGMVEFTLQYDPATQELCVIIHNCKGLTGGDRLPYPYVKTYLLPEAAKSSKKRTTTIKRTADPIYNETLVYHGISEADIKSKGLSLSVMDERVGNNSMIGGTCIPLKNLSSRPVQHFRRILDPKIDDNQLFLDSRNNSKNPGRIELGLHYLSKQEKLVVEIIRCSGLKSLDSNGYSDPYVKCYLLPDPNKRSKQKTAVKKKTLNPEFNEEFTYRIPHNELAKKTLHVSVWDHDIGRANDFIGGITLGIQSAPEELHHWFETLKNADKRFIRWHTLSEDIPIIE